MTAAFEIRPARRADLSALDALYARSYPRLLKTDYPPSVLVTALPLISKAQPALVRTGTYYVAEAPDGELLAAGGWTRARGRGLGSIRHVVTDDRHLRKGIGRAVMQRIFADSAAAGITRLECKSTFTAVPFYRALGFEALGTIEVTLAPGIAFPAIQMERRQRR